ncbi:hypothetical protein NG895_20885 [Aeoliella sp. ICT_H6.2]|uniref:Uncharacterized protein n=1 Tax=Aeoliella straminimaris TaxID=2954799 RepID=A0A9X2JJ43_9BACT|nr:hypothetical protein [Aeoliella straminimaris]MCO6046363.1 hypothetical protein [Aeoliella straminimaris]
MVRPTERFKIDYTYFLNLRFLGGTLVLWWLKRTGATMEQHGHHGESNLGDELLTWLAYLSFLGLAGGLVASLLTHYA